MGTSLWVYLMLLNGAEALVFSPLQYLAELLRQVNSVHLNLMESALWVKWDSASLELHPQ